MYKPIKEFAWQDASDEEIKEDSLPHYADRFKIEENKTKCVLVEFFRVTDLSEKAMLVIESLNCKTPIPKSAYHGKGENIFEHWVSEWVLSKLKREYEIKEIKYL